MDLIIPVLPVVTKDLPSSPRFTPYDCFIAMQVQYSTLTTRQPMVELLTFPRFPLRKKEHKSYFGKNRTSSLPSCLWSLRIFPALPGSCLTLFLSRCKFSTLITRQPMVELLTFPRFPLRKKEHKSYFGKNRTHDFRTSRCAGYLLDHTVETNSSYDRTY